MVLKGFTINYLQEDLIMKALFSIAVVALFAAAFSTSSVNAQVPATKAINGGVLNGKAVKLPKPAYPQAAKDAGAEGAVAVNVEIDEEGNVIWAEAELYDQRTRKAENGTLMEMVVIDPSLRQAAEDAARMASFSPTQLGGVPVKVKGKIMYNFVTTQGDSLPAGSGKTVSGGVLNGKATALPLPDYPAAAKAVNAGGSVSVQISIDEQGSVISAKALSGHPLLRGAAEKAAMGALFAPTSLNGEPVKVAGVLTYNFVP